MGEMSKIGWTDHTFNPWVGCARVSPGCQHCYAEAWAKRSGLVEWGQQVERRVTSDANWRKPHRWNTDAREAGRPALVFCASLADVFEDRLELDEPRRRLLELIWGTQQLIWLLLTKRPENIDRLLRPHGWITGGGRPDDWETARWAGPPNVWIGTTVEDQQRADERIPWLLSVPAPVRFLSCEPLLGPVTLTAISPIRQEPDDWPRVRQNALTGETSFGDVHPWHVDWVIAGGESGPGHRLLDPTWARALRNQCQSHQVPFFFKQVGGPKPTSGGDLLDGQRWNEFPPEARR